MRFPPKLVFLICNCVLLCRGSWAEVTQEPQSLVVITSNQRPVTGIEQLTAKNRSLEVKVYNLDEVTDIELHLSQSLPSDPIQAQIAAKAIIAKMGAIELKSGLIEAYQALILAMQYDLDRYPVMIFDQRAVILGITDAFSATGRYRQWAKSRKEVNYD